MNKDVISDIKDIPPPQSFRRGLVFGTGFSLFLISIITAKNMWEYFINQSPNIRVSYVSNKTRIHNSVTNDGKVRSGSVELIMLELRIMKLIISSFKRSENPKIFYNE